MMTRPLDDLGRICLPKEMRKSLGWNEYDRVTVMVDKGRVILQKFYGPICAACGSMDASVSVGQIQLCKSCATSIKEE